jgi:hypothetical protein
MLQWPVARKNIKELMYDDYEDIIAITTIKEDMIEQVAKPGPAKPAEAKPAEAQAKPAEANPPKVKPVKSAKVKPVKSTKANPTPVPVPVPVPVKPVKPANPAHAQGEEATLRRAGASRVSSGQAPTKVERQSEEQSEGQSEEQIQAPTQGQSEKQDERQSEEQIGEAVKRGQGEEENQIFRPDESNSGNMFVIPLMGVVLALAITFLVKK